MVLSDTHGVQHVLGGIDGLLDLFVASPLVDDFASEDLGVRTQNSGGVFDLLFEGRSGREEA